MLAAAKQHELPESEVQRWQGIVDTLNREVETARPPDARLRSLLCKKRDREANAAAHTAAIKQLESQLAGERRALAEAEEALVQIAADIASVKEVSPPGTHGGEGFRPPGSIFLRY